MSRHSPTALALLVALVAMTGCSSDPPDQHSRDDSSGDDHGAVSGAEEVAEPQLGLTTIDPSGTVRHLDLLDESVLELGATAPPRAMTTDGRYLFVETEHGIEVVDSGVWTWDHVDHFHYYRADPRMVGIVDGAGPATVSTTNLSTAGSTGIFFADSGTAVLLDTEALSKGRIAERFRIDVEPHDGLVVPAGRFALVSEPASSTPARIRVYSSDGAPTGTVETCADAAGTITTRVGTVIGCADGALLATVDDGELTVERIPYPADLGAPAGVRFDNREGRPTVAALAGEDAIWLLDTRQRSWSLLPAPRPLVSATAVDDAEAHVLALTQDGSVVVLDGTDGRVLSETDPLVADSLAAGMQPTLIADQQRAYLSAPLEQRLYEIDFADDARIARTFATTTPAAFTAETGR